MSASLIAPFFVPRINNVLDSVPILRDHKSLSSLVAGMVVFGIAKGVRMPSILKAVVIGVAGAFILTAVLTTIHSSHKQRSWSIMVLKNYRTLATTQSWDGTAQTVITQLPRDFLAQRYIIDMNTPAFSYWRSFCFSCHRCFVKMYHKYQDSCSWRRFISNYIRM